jgi:hypothetical protein
MCSGMAISVTAWEKHKPQGTAGIRYPPKHHYTTPGGLRNRREEGDAATLRVEPALQDEGGGELIDFAAGSLARVVAGSFEGGVRLGGREALVPEMNGEAGAVCARGVFALLAGGLGKERLEFIDKAMDALGLAAAISGEVQRIANDNAGAVVTACEPEDGALIAAGLGALDGEQRLRNAEGIGERDTDAAGADIEAEPRLELCAHAANDSHGSGERPHDALRRELRVVLAAYTAGIQAGLQSRECFD